MRRSQHREKREANNREAADLKREVQLLKRQLARAQRETQRLSGVAEDPLSDEVVPEKKKVKKTLGVCSKCESSEHLFPFVTPGGKKLTACKKCKFSWEAT